MRYERLFIERQMNDITNEKRRLQQEMTELESKIKDTRQQTEVIRQRMRGEISGSDKRRSGGGHHDRHKSSKHHHGSSGQSAA